MKVKELLPALGGLVVVTSVVIVAVWFVLAVWNMKAPDDRMPWQKALDRAEDTCVAQMPPAPNTNMHEPLYLKWSNRRDDCATRRMKRAGWHGPYAASVETWRR